MAAAPPSPTVRLWRRVIVAGFIGLSLLGIVAGYSGSRVFAWQMFPEASRWQADIVRVTHDGERRSIEDAWPGGYAWSELVTASGLAYPSTEGHAAYGIDTTLDALQHALNWVAQHTPLDGETAYLEATVRYRHNADPWQTATLRSVARGTS